MRSALYRWLNPPLVRLYRLAIKARIVEMALDYLLCRFSPNVSIPLLESTHATGDMEQDWDMRARVDALITATSKHDEKSAADESTRAVDAWLLSGLPNAESAVVLEIGCGIGALLRPLAERVREVHGVDISGEMLKQAKARLTQHPNVVLHKTSGTLDMLPACYFDLVFSSGVFIHFPRKEHVYGYIREAARVLKPGGLLRFQVDGRSYLRWRASHAGTVRGVVFTPKEVHEHLEECGFAVQQITGQDTIDMWATAVMAGKPPSAGT